MKPPSDRKILQYIYDTYYEEFSSFVHEQSRKESENDENSRRTKIYVPISVEEIGNHFGVDKDIIFGRLYYYLNKKYNHRDFDNTLTYFFTSIKDDGHCINFALLSSVLASLHEDYQNFWVTTTIAIYATIIAALAVLTTIFL